MFITVISTMNYNEKMKLDTWSKRTQTKPILPVIAGKIVPSAHVPEQRRSSRGTYQNNYPPEADSKGILA